MKKPWKKENKFPIKEIIKQRKKLLKPFIKKYGKPVIVHATPYQERFEDIVRSGKIKLPKKHNISKMSPYMEKLLGIYNVIYYSLGFVYNNAYGWKYGFIFDLGDLKELTYYDNSVNYMAYVMALFVWEKYDKNYFDKIANTNRLTKSVFKRYKKDKKFRFWEIEKVLINALKDYSGKKKIIELIKKEMEKFHIKYPASVRSAKKDWDSTLKKVKVPEIIGRKDNNILKNKHLLGFYIKGKTSKSLMDKIKKDYKGKILFDGKKIEVIR